jgi:hypothetical protein
MEGVDHCRHHDDVYNSTQHDHWKWKCLNFGELVWAGQHVKGFTMEHWYPIGFLFVFEIQLNVNEASIILCFDGVYWSLGCDFGVSSFTFQNIFPPKL